MVRPYGKFGEPMPWSNRPRKNFFPYANENDLDGVLVTVKNCIIEWANVKAGQISATVIGRNSIEEATGKQADGEGSHTTCQLSTHIRGIFASGSCHPAFSDLCCCCCCDWDERL